MALVDFLLQYADANTVARVNRARIIGSSPARPAGVGVPQEPVAEVPSKAYSLRSDTQKSQTCDQAHLNALKKRVRAYRHVELESREQATHTEELQALEPAPIEIRKSTFTMPGTAPSARRSRKHVLKQLTREIRNDIAKNKNHLQSKLFGRYSPGELVTSATMLVTVLNLPSVEAITTDFCDTTPVDAHVMSRWREYVVVARSTGVASAPLLIEFHTSRRVQRRTDASAAESRSRHNDWDFLLHVDSVVTLYNCLDKSVAVYSPMCPANIDGDSSGRGRGRGCCVYVFQALSSCKALDWVSVLRGALGARVSRNVQVYVPETSEYVTVAVDAGSEVQHIVAATRQHLHAKNGEKTWLQRQNLCLAWKLYDRLEWVPHIGQDFLAHYAAMSPKFRLELRNTDFVPQDVVAPAEGVLTYKSQQFFFCTVGSYLCCVSPHKCVPALSSEPDLAQNEFASFSQAQNLKNARFVVDLCDVCGIEPYDTTNMRLLGNGTGNGEAVILRAKTEQMRDEWVQSLREIQRCWAGYHHDAVESLKSLQKANLEHFSLADGKEAAFLDHSVPWEYHNARSDPRVYSINSVSLLMPIVVEGDLYYKPQKHSNFKKYRGVLVNGSLVLYSMFENKRLRVESRERLCYKRSITLTLSTGNCYVYASRLTGTLLLNRDKTFNPMDPGSHTLPRIYADGWKSSEDDHSRCFAVWMGSKKVAKSKNGLKVVNRLGIRGRNLVFMARSRQERDMWVVAMTNVLGRARRDEVAMV